MQVLDKILEEINQAKTEPWYRLNDKNVKNRMDQAIEAKGEFAHTDKPSWCPIRPMPKKSEIDPLGENSYLAGWNDCISYFEDN